MKKLNIGIFLSLLLMVGLCSCGAVSYTHLDVYKRQPPDVHGQNCNRDKDHMQEHSYRIHVISEVKSWQDVYKRQE